MEEASVNLCACLIGVPENMSSINKQQAAAIVDALLAPRTAEMDAARTKREQQREQARALHQKKRGLAILSLISGTIGIAVAHYTGQGRVQGLIYGALLGAGIGWVACAMWRRAARN